MPRLENAYALIVGICEYENINPLPKVADANDVAAVLTDQGLCGYRPENVRVLQDSQATLAALSEGMQWLEQQTDGDSTVFIYFSGHGGRIENGEHEGEYLLPVDTKYPDDAALAASSMSGDTFQRHLRGVRGQKVLVVFDCCHAGGIGSPKSVAESQVKAGLTKAYFDALKAGRGRVILASCRPDEYSYILPDRNYSLFTEHFLAGLRGGVSSEDGLVRVFNLFEYLQPRVTKDRRVQHPLFRSELEDNFPVALFRGGEKGVIARDSEGYQHDAYVSYVDQGNDTRWVWEELVPRLEEAGLRVAVSGDVEEPGVARVVGIERGIRHSKRTIVVLSEAYLRDTSAEFQNVLSQEMGIQEGSFRLLPIKIQALDASNIPTRIFQLVTLNFADDTRQEREWERLIGALKGPLPKRQ